MARWKLERSVKKDAWACKIPPIALLHAESERHRHNDKYRGIGVQTLDLWEAMRSGF